MNYDSLIMLNNCIKSELPLDVIEIINENMIINKVRELEMVLLIMLVKQIILNC